jgi:hypothetical protein
VVALVTYLVTLEEMHEHHRWAAGWVAQTTDGVRKAVHESNFFCWYHSPNDTDLEQVVDAGLGRELKRHIANQYEEYISDVENLEMWESGIDAMTRRVLMTKWVAESFDHIMKLNIRRYFQKTGCLMTINGVDDDKINPEGTQSYRFALTPEEVIAQAQEHEQVVPQELNEVPAV